MNFERYEYRRTVLVALAMTLSVTAIGCQSVGSASGLLSKFRSTPNGLPDTAQSANNTLAASPATNIQATRAAPNASAEPEPAARQLPVQVIPASHAQAIDVASTTATAARDASQYLPQIERVQYCAPQDTNSYPAWAATAACSPGCSGCAVCAQRAPIHSAQEYIYDGGDQQPTVVIKEDWSAAGIDVTDTVVYYETETGLVCVQPTNRVPIYAPRFGAVRQTTGPFLAAKATGPERFLAPLKPDRFDDLSPPGTVMQPLAPAGEEQVNLIDAFQENALGRPIESIIPPYRMSEARVPFEEVDVMRTGRITDEEIAVLGRVLQNARTWFIPESIGVMIDGQQAHLAINTQKPQDIHVFELPDKCALRICKTASHTIADSGDIVSFTIRFDNVGPKAVGNVVIVDSLSPRLDYIENSQQSSLGTRFSVEPNEAGSLVLRWELEQPIDKNDGGVVSFDCRVR